MMKGGGDQLFSPISARHSITAKRFLNGQMG